MSIQLLSLKELRALAHQRLGTRAAELKTRQELIDALAATEPRSPLKAMAPLAAPLPPPAPVIPNAKARELPPELVLWTGREPVPQITSVPLEQVFPVARATWPPPMVAGTRLSPRGMPAVPITAAKTSALAGGAEAAPATVPLVPAGPAAQPPRQSAPSHRLGKKQKKGRSVRTAPEQAAPHATVGYDEAQNVGATMVKRLPPERVFSPAEPLQHPVTITQYFFLEPEEPRLPASYRDDRVLTFARDPNAMYVSWDFAPEHFEQGPAEGRVVNEAGEAVQTFAVAGPSGSIFVSELPASSALKVEVHRDARVFGTSAWVWLAGGPDAPASTARLDPGTPPNAPSSVV